MNSDRLEYLVRNLLLSNLSTDEEQELSDLMTESPSEEVSDLFAAYYEKYKTPIPLAPHNREAIWNNIHQHLPSNTNKLNWNMMIRVAAVFILFFSVLTITYFYSKQSPQDLQDGVLQHSIFLKNKPAAIFLEDNLLKRHTLLSDAELGLYGISIDSTGAILIVGEEKNRVSSLKKANLFIKSSAAQVQAIVLSDGSKVWLNSNSAITLPNSFSSISREVHLVGEGYFEVAKLNFKPFRVRSGGMITDVLGTHFTVKNVINKATKVTLIEGKVKVSNSKDSLVLSPGEQATESQGHITKIKVDMMDLLAWKEGYFKFENASTSEIIEQIKDWYDVKYVQIDAVKDERFSGTYKRTNELKDLLKNLEEVSSIKFRIKEGGIHVLSK